MINISTRKSIPKLALFPLLMGVGVLAVATHASAGMNIMNGCEYTTLGVDNWCTMPRGPGPSIRTSSINWAVAVPPGYSASVKLICANSQAQVCDITSDQWGNLVPVPGTCGAGSYATLGANNYSLGCIGSQPSRAICDGVKIEKNPANQQPLIDCSTRN